MTAKEAGETLQTKLGLDATPSEFRGEVSLQVPRDQIKQALRCCRDELGFNYLIDISSLDHLGEEPRFEVVYELYALAEGVHLRLRTSLDDDQIEVETASDLWPTADWHEREVFDMMGIQFTKHPDLRRILMWEGYPYYPLRKDFPLGGKETDLPDVAFTATAPLAGGPFVTAPGEGGVRDREPQARS